MVWFFGSDVTMTCQRSADTCVLEKTTTFGSTQVVSSFPLSRLKSARVETQQSKSSKKKNKKKTTHRVILITDDGEIPFSSVRSSDHSEHQQRADAINSFLKSSKEHFSITQSGEIVRWIGYLFSLIGILVFLRGLWGIFKKMLITGVTIAAR